MPASLFHSLVYTTIWANPGLKCWAPGSVFAPRGKRKEFISESLPGDTAEGQAFACLSFFLPLSLSFSVLSFVFCFFLFEELKMKVDSGRL